MLRTDEVDCIKKSPELYIWDRIIPKHSESCVCECPVKEKVQDESAVTEKIGDIVNPKPLTIYEQYLQAKAECRYLRSRYPIGRGALNPPYVPCCFDKINLTFGVPTKTGESAKELINPSKSADQVACESLAGHELYKITHKAHLPGEFVSRNYCSPSYNPFARFGDKSGCDREGKKTKCLMQPDLNRCEPISFASCRFNEYSDKYSDELGKHRNPLRDSSCLPPEFAHGKPSVLGTYTLGDLLHYRDETNFTNGKDALRSKIARVRNHLKKANWTNFKSAEQAFHFYDKEKKGFIDAESLRAVLLQFNIVLNNRELCELIRDCKETCHNSNETLFNCCNCCCQCRMIGLNKRHCIFNCNHKIPCVCTDLSKLPVECKSGTPGASCDPNGQESPANSKKCNNGLCTKYVPECNKPSDCCKRCGRDMFNCTCDLEKKTKAEHEDCCTPSNDCVTSEVITFQEFLHFLTFFPYIFTTNNTYEGRRLVKQIDKRGSDHFRTSQEVNSVFGEVDINEIYAFGKKSDLTKSLIEEMGTSTNVLQLQKKLDRVKPLLNPHILLSYGFTDEDISKPRTLEQIMQIFGVYFEILDQSGFEALYKEASLQSKDGMVSVEQFKKVLDRRFSYGCLSLFRL